MRSLQPTSPKKSLVADCLNRYRDSQTFLTTFNPSNQLTFSKYPDRCFIGHAPTLVTVSQTFGENITESWLEIQLRDLNELSGCKEKMTTNQIEQIAGVIILEFYFLKVTEMMYFFTLFKAGKFGKFYGAVDAISITVALREFLKLRQERLAQIENEQIKLAREKAYQERDQNAVSYEEYLRFKNKAI